MSEEEILKRMEELCKCCTNNIFSNGLYTETYEIRATAAHIRGDILRDKPDSKVDSELIYESFANAKSIFGSYGYIIEVPNEKEQSVIIDCEEQFILDPLHQYNKKIPTQFIKGAIFRLDLGDHTEYFFIENDRYINKDNLSSDTKTGIQSSNSKEQATLLIGTQIPEKMQEIIKGEIAREVQSTQTEIGKNIEEQTQSNDIKKTGEETK